MDSTCSATSGRASVARTTAPRLPAVPMAARPATPAPTTRTLAGGTFPAAVTCPVKNDPNSFAASMIARYPAMLAIEDSTSRDCAREMRGTASIAMAVTPWAASCSSNRGFSAGATRLTTIAPLRISPISVASGALIFATRSAPQTFSASPIVAPAATYAPSSKLASAPAPDSMTTS